jgi:hypothetical protein
VFVDTKTGKVVESQPEEGVQIVAPGAPLDASALAAIARERNPETATTVRAPGRTDGDAATADDGGSPAKTVTTTKVK